eukprot:TRINITY_DN4675_c1_g1_i2.p1 TRINITY_DN4675_c1_g1~~TRINITY_DN4675_c1_g1_i2.p1  ORF type:complete len:506 (-),score=202.12 TRINITY_DN4675_c1_g1_i2:23-1540(-)
MVCSIDFVFTKTEQQMNPTRDAIRRAEQKKILCDAFVSKVRREIALMEQYRIQINSILQGIPVSRIEGDADLQEAATLQSASLKKMEHALQGLKTMMKNGKASESDLQTFIEQEMEGTSAAEWIASMQHISKRWAQESHLTVQSLDLNKEGLRLRDRYREQFGRDPPSVADLMTDQRRFQLERFYETEDILNQVHDLQERNRFQLETLRQSVPENSKILDLFEEERKNTAEKLEENSLDFQILELEANRKQVAAKIDEISTKLAAIQAHSKTSEQKEGLVKKLVADVVQEKFKLNFKLKKMKEFSRQKISGPDPWTAYLSNMSNHVNTELDIFDKLDIGYIPLQDPKNGMLDVRDASIYLSSDVKMSNLLGTLGMPSFSGSDEILSKAGNLREKLEKLKEALELHRIAMESSKKFSAEFSETRLKEMASLSQNQQRKQLYVWFPPLLGAIRDARVALGECQTVAGIAKDWEEQPAQKVIPWVKVDGLNIQEWSERLKSLFTQSKT